MASEVPAGDNSNTKSGDGTMTFYKKRARRVSFAENTSVHIFDRDEDSGTPSDPKPPSSPSDNLASAERDNEPNQLFWNVGDDEDDMEEPGSRSPFFRLDASPSSGGSTIGSATSNDEDNFFGPVSSSFIRRDLLDSEASDGNHDHTMDSTAFSMHFRSIARSDSEVELKTTTGVHLPSEEKTHTQDSIHTNTGSPMLMTLAKKPNHQPSVSASKLSTCSGSNDMSIVGEYHYKYDYGELSPKLKALLAEGGEDLSLIAPSTVSILKSPINAETTKENGASLMDFSYNEDNMMEVINIHETEQNGMGVANEGPKFSPSKQIVLGASSNTSDVQTSKPLPPTSSIMVTPTAKMHELVKDTFQIKSSLDFSATAQGTPNPKNAIDPVDDVTRKEHKSSFLGPVISLIEKPSHMILDGASPSKSPWAVTPSFNYSSVSARAENTKRRGSVSSIQKSISKLRMLEASPFSAALIAKLEDSNSRAVVLPSRMTPLSALMEKNGEVSAPNCMNNKEAETLDTRFEGLLSSVAQKKRERVNSTNMDDIRLETPKNGVPVTRMQNFVKVSSPLSNLLSTETRNGYKDNKDKTGFPQNCDFSPQKKLKTEKSLEVKGSPLRDAKQFNEHHEPVKFGPVHAAGSGENVSNTSLSTAAADRMDASYIERRDNSGPLISTEEKVTGNRKILLHEVRCNSERKENSTTLSKDKEHEKFQPGFTESDIPIGQLKTASLVTREMTDEQSCQKDLHDQFCQSPSNKEAYNVSLNANIDPFLGENVPSPGAHGLSNGDVVSAERQRETEDLTVEKIARIQRSPNLIKDYADPKHSSVSVISTFGNTLKHPADIHASFSKETKQLLPQSVDKFNLHAIDRLEGILDQLHRSKTYQLLSAEIQSQTSLDVNSNLLFKTAEETKFLLCKLVHEQAKLQLVQLKREKLLKRAQSLASRIQESEVLRLSFPPQQSLDVHCQSSDNIKDVQENKIDSDKVTSMRQTVDDIDRRISNLTKSFHKSCKMKGEPTYADTIAFVNSYLMKRARSHIIRKDLQLLVVANLESQNGFHSVVLNYLDLMTQRLTVNAGPAPSVSVLHELNDVNINKSFKDMDACIAFRFVFNADTQPKHACATSLAQGTQVTGSCLGNLLDVVEEIQYARIELKNLIFTRFHTPLAKQLHLELRFFDPKTRRKATVTLNTSCLQRGIYPSEIVPCEVDIPVNDLQNSSSQSFSAEITAAVEDLRTGYSRIERLCRCISELISPPIR